LKVNQTPTRLSSPNAEKSSIAIEYGPFSRSHC
jgi:hypothetical protein